MTGPRPIGAILRDKYLTTYFQCCCALRGRPAGAGAPQRLHTAILCLRGYAGAQDQLGTLAEAAERALSGWLRPGLIERAYGHGTRRPDPPGPAAA